MVARESALAVCTTLPTKSLRKGDADLKIEQFALTEASYTTIRLMQKFKSIESRDDRPWMEWLTLTVAIDQGTIVGLTPA